MSLTTGPRPLVFNAFLTNTVSHIHHGMWRHPDSRQADYTDHVAPVLAERGLMQREYRPGTLREKLFPGRGPRLPESHPARQVRIPADSENPVR